MNHKISFLILLLSVLRPGFCLIRGMKKTVEIISDIMISHVRAYSPTNASMSYSDDTCGEDGCKHKPAWGAYRQTAYSEGGGMKHLVCCDKGFGCSPCEYDVTVGLCNCVGRALKMMSDELIDPLPCCYRIDRST